MQKFTKLLIVLPCHSLEDFPTHHQGNEAAELLANWTALWYPALIASAETKPGWQQADNPDPGLGVDPLETDPAEPVEPTPQVSGVCLAVIPSISESLLEPELLANLEKHNSVVISGLADRDAIIRAALEANPPAQQLAIKLDPALALDFLALGYAYLQVQIMTRQLRYSSNLDEEAFTAAVVKAAQLATEGNTEPAREGLVRCFDMLLEEKNGYYPVEPELIDVVLTASTTLGKSLAQQLKTPHALNVLMTGVVARTLVDQQSNVSNTLKERIEAKTVTMIGGLDDELPDSLLATESTLNQLQRGRTELNRIFGAAPTVFMRRRFGLTSSTPGLLEQLNFNGAVHATLDDGKFPRSSSCNIRWTGDDERSILAFGEMPMSASDAGSFLGLGLRLGEAIDSAHLAAALFVHWPGDTCEAFEDLVRISNYGPLFGNFVTLDDYFETVYDPGYGDTFAADEYKPPFLKQSVARREFDPISRYTDYWENHYQLFAARALLVQACARSRVTESVALEFERRFREIQIGIHASLMGSDQEEASSQTKTNLAERLAECLNDVGQLNTPKDSSDASAAIEVVNPASFRRRIEVNSNAPGRGSQKSNPPVLLSDQNEKGSRWLVEVPPMGSASLDLEPAGRIDALASDPAVGDGLTLRNEFFEAFVDETTGGIRGIQLYRSRLNLVGQQLAIRIPGESDSRKQPLTKARYTQMQADDIQLVTESRLAASIVSRGRLMDAENILAEFEQSVRVVRGLRIVEVEVEVRPKTPLTDSINHYVCSRLAWKSEASRVIANAAEIRQEINSDWFSATQFMELVQDDHRLTMLTGGLPFHRRVSRRMVDSVLMVGRERKQKFRFGLAVDQGYSMAAAAGWLTPHIERERPAIASRDQATRWLFHFDCKNILVTWWEPFFDSAVDIDTDANEDASWSGVRIRLRETEGRAGKLSIRCPHPIDSAEQQNFGGESLRVLDVAEDDPTKAGLSFGRFDYFQVLIRWKK